MEGTAAAAAALWAFLCHFDHPVDAIAAAAHAGGDTDTVACMAGALAGALHGGGWVPAQWWGALENEPQTGRDAALAVAAKLAELDCRD